MREESEIAETLRSRRLWRLVSNCAGRTILAAPFGRTVSDEREELLTPTGVRIGEEGNLAMLTYKEWNLLIDLIQAGELTKVPV